MSEDDAEATLTLAAAGRIEGRLLGSDEPQRFPVALGRQGSAEKGESLRLAYPDGNGRFVFEALRPGGYRIAARRPEDNGRWVRGDEVMFEIRELCGQEYVHRYAGQTDDGEKVTTAAEAVKVYT